MRKEVAILTTSLKNGGYCVAGVDINTGDWVRFVSNDERTHGALSISDITYKNRRICKPLDVVSVDVVAPAPLPHQPENYLINSNGYWVKIGQYTLFDVLRVHPAETSPFIYGNPRPYVTGREIDDISYSLTLVNVSFLLINQTTNMCNKRKTKASFIYNRNCYSNMSVTDPQFFSVPDGTAFANSYLVISLPDAPFPTDRYYKFVAQIFTP